jgi:hypothetical protein
LAVLLLTAAGPTARAVELIDDRAITIHSAADVAEKRRALIEFIWGGQGFPSARQPDAVTKIESPVKQLDALERVEDLRIDMAPGLQGQTFYFIPRKPNGELVVVHHGHDCTFDDDPSPNDAGYGLQRTINALLHDGYGVLGVFMPHKRPGDCTGNHDAMFQLKTIGNPMKYFLESTAISLNYAKSLRGADQSPVYHAFHMVGLSGGGWTTTVYAAIDPTIRCSFPVAGTIPLYLRARGSIGDREQYDADFYRLAGYPDLYLLGSQGKGRQQVQILNRKDDCCFGQAEHDPKTSGMTYDAAMREYETRVQAALREIGDASFRLEIDETAPSHMISHHAIEDLILPELRKAK